MKKRFFKYILTAPIFAFGLSAMDQSIAVYDITKLDNSFSLLGTGQTLQVLGTALSRIVKKHNADYSTAITTFENSLKTATEAAAIETAIRNVRASLSQTRTAIRESEIAIAHGSVPEDMPPLQLSGSVANRQRQQADYIAKSSAHQQTLDSYKTQILQAYQDQQKLLIDEQNELYRNTLDAVNGILNLARILHAGNQIAIQSDILKRIQDKCSGRLSGVKGENILALRTGDVDGHHITMHDVYTILQEVRQDIEVDMQEHVKQQEQTITDLNAELAALRQAAASGAYAADKVLEQGDRHIDISGDWAELMTKLSKLPEITIALTGDGIAAALLEARRARVEKLIPEDFSRLVRLNEAAELKKAQIKVLDEAFSIGDPSYSFEDIAEERSLLDVEIMVEEIKSNCQRKGFNIADTTSLEHDLVTLNQRLMHIITNTQYIQPLAMHIIYSLGGYIGFGKELGPKMLKELGIAAAGYTTNEQIKAFQDAFTDKFNGQLESLNAEPFMFSEEKGRYLAYSIQNAIMLRILNNVISYCFEFLISCSLDAIHPDITAFQKASIKFLTTKNALELDPNNGQNKDMTKSRSLIGRNFDQAQEEISEIKKRLKMLHGVPSHNITIYKQAILEALKNHLKCKSILDLINKQVRNYFAGDVFWKTQRKTATLCQIAFLPLQDFEFNDADFDFAKYEAAILDISKLDTADKTGVREKATLRFRTIKDALRKNNHLTKEQLAEHIEHYSHMDELLMQTSDGFRKDRLKNYKKAEATAGTTRTTDIVFSIPNDEFVKVMQKSEEDSKRTLSGIVNEVSAILPAVIPPAPPLPPPLPAPKKD